MRIDVWSDVVCPWCYIGKRRLETAIVEFSASHPDADVEVVWRSFELDPSAPVVPVETVAESLGRKYGGGPAAGQAMIDRVEAVAAEEGMVWRHHSSLRVNTVTAHRLLHWALHQGGADLQGQLKQALLAAYFEQERNVADVDTLVELASSVGLDPARARQIIEGNDFADEVEEDVRQAAALGATGVPFFVVDQKYGISGAQPVEFFSQVIARAWDESRPAVTLLSTDSSMLPSDSSAVCGPDGCTI
ncbi:MAG TPA: DsbA family oxidoreductase [Marmoricola sp.]|nr:DsbA family oxidoreductase [Marmoricola sp.]